ncbi:hypothetical protein V6Z12_D05G344700 [Gossypium hirsutum]
MSRSFEGIDDEEYDDVLIDSTYQTIIHEVGQMLQRKLEPIKERLKKLDERFQREQISSSQEMKKRSSRRHYSTRDSYQDFYSTRRSRPREANSEFESFRDDKRKSKRVSTSASIYSSTKDYLRRGERVSRVSKYSATEDLSQREDCHLYEEPFSYSQQKVSLFDDLYFCNEIETSCEKEKERERENENEKEMKEKEDECEIEKKIENEIENKNECEKEKEIEKESEIEGRNESAKEMSDMVKERGFENELEKERNEKDESEKERSVVTNHPMNFPCFVSTFQVSRNPIYQFQLQYFSKEKRFRLVEKGKIVDDPSPQVLKGKPCKGSTVFESSQSYLILDDEISKDLVCEKVFHLDLIGNHNLIVDKCVLHSNVKYLSAHEPIIVKIDQEVSPGKPKQKLGLCDEKLTSNLFACDDHVNYLNCGVNFPCLRVRMKYEGFDCSNVCMPNSYLLDMCEVI